MVAATPRFVRAPDWPHAVEPDVFTRFGDDLGRRLRRHLDRFIAWTRSAPSMAGPS